MTTERDALGMVADLRAHLKAYPNDSRARDELRRLVQEMASDAAGQPIELSTWEGQSEPEPRRWLVNGWLPAGRVALCTGAGGVGKSRLALQLAAGIASGGNGRDRAWIAAPRDVLSLGADVESEGSAVVYASWEDEPKEFWRRLGAISNQKAAPWVTPKRLQQLYVADMAGRGPIWAPSSGSRHISTMATITPAGRELRRRCEEVGARLLVLDPLAAAYASDENARGLVRAFVSDWDAWGRAENCASFIVAHIPKSGAIYSGSTDWHGASRTMWSLDKNQRLKASGRGKEGNQPQPFEWRLTCNKLNYGPEATVLHMDLDTSDDGLRWQVVGTWDTSSDETTATMGNGYDRAR